MSTYVPKILVVDDTAANLISLKAILECPEKEIITSSSGNDALRLLLSEDIDIVLLDVQMPDMDGFEVAELMKSNAKTCNIPIIFVTAINKEERNIFKGY